MYLGRLFDLATSALSDRLEYDPADLTTHAVVTGMTGSGKTGLCIVILEEAALQGIPALIIDPKGDLTNLRLHFPDLAPQDFQPWIDPEAARRAGQSLEETAQKTAATWRQGLNEWGIGRERLLALQNAVDYAIYTPGSSSGQPLNLLASLATPSLAWEEHREALRERILTTVSALLSLIGEEDRDPFTSRPHILLSNLFEHAWSQNRSLDLTELILQIQNPPFETLGAFPINTFYPAKERNALALRLNNLLAAPAFEAWREGQPLDIPSLLYTPEGRPRHSIFTLAHLGDAERMFFITLLLAAVETWMRTQPGSPSLRFLLYMDELFGYLPPIQNPPSKAPLLRLLKTARAFGLGLLLATQNPVDLDYKALSNAGTWFIGRLQTEQDKARLLDGLESAAPGLERPTFDRLISALRPRLFLLHNVHNPPPRLFQTRWAMNFLAGPLTRPQIAQLMKKEAAAPAEAKSTAPGRLPASAIVAGGSEQPAAPLPQSAPTTPSQSAQSPSLGSQTKPAIPAGVLEAFLRENLPLSRALEKHRLPAGAQLVGLLYRPALGAIAEVRFREPRYGVDTTLRRAALAPSPRLPIRWEDYATDSTMLEALASEPAAAARYLLLPAPLDDARQLATLQKDFLEWVLRTSQVVARANEALKVYAGPDVSPAEFRQACADTARQARDAELARELARLERQIRSLEEKIAREERELEQEQVEYEHRKAEEWGTHAENLFGLFGGRRSTRRLSSSLTKRRLTEQAKARLEESQRAIEQYRQEIATLEAERQRLSEEITARWSDLANDITEIPIPAKRNAITLHFFGILWCPAYLVQVGDALLECPAYE